LFTLIQGGEVYAPEPLGVRSVLLVDGKIGRIGEVDQTAIERTGLPVEVIDARGCVVTPGLIDPHEHLAGGGGEQGFGTREPEVSFEEIVRAGITTVVGLLGTDTTTRNLTTLLGKVRELRQRGLSAYMLTGGFPVPPPTITDSVTSDLVLLPEVIGVGEIAISDERSYEPTTAELARLTSAAMVGGRLGGKAGFVHYHVGEHPRCLKKLFALIQMSKVPPETIYPTHANRNEAVLDDCVALSRQGGFVDMDTIDEDTPRWLARFRERGGRPDRLTISSDARTPGGEPDKVRRMLAACVRTGTRMEEALPMSTSSPAGALGLSKRKGRLAEGMDADVAVMEPGKLEAVHVIAGGRRLMKDGEVCDERD
jgi:beta-aspartyl-dipeptidase (metallo-type)